MQQALTQIGNGELAAAAESFENALRSYERQTTSSAAQLQAYLVIGDAYQRSGYFGSALDAYFRARDISRQEFGLFNVGQVEILRKIADSIAATEDLEAAKGLQREAIDLVARAHGNRSRQVADATLYYADWLAEHGHLGEASQQYDRAGAILRSLPDRDALETVRILREAAQYAFIASADLGSKLGRPEPLIRALNILQPGLVVPHMSMRYAESSSTHISSGADINTNFGDSYGCADFDPDIVDQGRLDRPLLVAEILRDIGDWCVALDIRQFFENAHLLAWNALALVEDGEQLRQEWFSTPTPVYMPSLRSDVLSESNDALTGRIELQFNVDDSGQPRRIKVVASDPEDLLDREARRLIGDWRFRPRIENGQLVAADAGVELEFRYDPERAQ